MPKYGFIVLIQSPHLLISGSFAPFRPLSFHSEFFRSIWGSLRLFYRFTHTTHFQLKKRILFYKPQISIFFQLAISKMFFLYFVPFFVFLRIWCKRGTKQIFFSILAHFLGKTSWLITIFNGIILVIVRFLCFLMSKSRKPIQKSANSEEKSNGKGYFLFQPEGRSRKNNILRQHLCADSKQGQKSPYDWHGSAG